MTRVLSASLCGTAGRGKRSWKQALGGCGWNSDFREGSVMECPVYWWAEGWPAVALVLPCKVQDPTLCPIPIYAHSQMCHTILFVFCFSFWLLFWIKLACLSLSISVMGVGCYTKGGVSIYRGKNPKPLWCSSRLPELSLLGDSSLKTLGSITPFSVAISWVFQILKQNQHEAILVRHKNCMSFYQCLAIFKKKTNGADQRT